MVVNGIVSSFQRFRVKESKKIIPKFSTPLILQGFSDGEKQMRHKTASFSCELRKYTSFHQEKLL